MTACQETVLWHCHALSPTGCEGLLARGGPRPWSGGPMQASGRVSLVGFRMGGPGAPLTQAVADLGRGASGAGEIKREEQEDEENLAAEHEEEKKEPKV